MAGTSYLFAVKFVTVYVVGLWLVDSGVQRYGRYRLRATVDEEDVKRELLESGEVTEAELEAHAEADWRDLVNLENDPERRHYLRIRAVKLGFVAWILTAVLAFVVAGIGPETPPTPFLAVLVDLLMLWPVSAPTYLAAWLPIEVAALALVALFLDYVLRLEGFARP